MVFLTLVLAYWPPKFLFLFNGSARTKTETLGFWERKSFIGIRLSLYGCINKFCCVNSVHSCCVTGISFCYLFVFQIFQISKNWVFCRFFLQLSDNTSFHGLPHIAAAPATLVAPSNAPIPVQLVCSSIHYGQAMPVSVGLSQVSIITLVYEEFFVRTLFFCF